MIVKVGRVVADADLSVPVARGKLKGLATAPELHLGIGNRTLQLQVRLVDHTERGERIGRRPAGCDAGPDHVDIFIEQAPVAYVHPGVQIGSAEDVGMGPSTSFLKQAPFE